MHTYTHATRIHMHMHVHKAETRTHVDVARALARARARFLRVYGGGRCGSSSVRNIGSDGTDISIIVVSIRTGSVAPVRRSVRTSVCPSVRPSVPSALAAVLERGAAAAARFKL